MTHRANSILLNCFLALILILPSIRIWGTSYPKDEIATINNCFDKYNYYLNLNIDSAIYFTRQAGKIAYEIRDFEDLSKSLTYQGIAFRLQGDLNGSMKLLLLALEIENRLGKPNFKTTILLNIANVFFDLENFKKTEEYLLKALENIKIQKDKKHPGTIISHLGTVYDNQNQPEKALAHFRQALKIAIAYNDTNLIATSYVDIGLTFFDAGKKDSAEILFQKAIPLFLAVNEMENLTYTYFYLGIQRLEDNQINEAEKYMMLVESYIEKTGSDLLRIQLYKYLSEISERKKAFKQALHYNQLMTIWKDSLHNKDRVALVHELSLKYETEKLNQEYELVKKDNDLKSIALSNSRLLQFIVIIVFIVTLILTLLIGFIIFLRTRARKKLDQLQAVRREEQVKQKMQELELKALRVQMNPHFIFNCLSSIRNCVEQKRLDQAENYLSKFGKLLRKMLLISENPEVMLKDELEYLGLYLDMEKMRFGDKFTYNFQIDENIDPENISIPVMMLQPFLENSIKHGFTNTNKIGLINVRVKKLDNEYLQIVIEDNGIGRKKSAELKQMNDLQKSFGIQITKDRLFYLNSNSSYKDGISINDILGPDNEIAGTSVEFKLPYKNTGTDD